MNNPKNVMNSGLQYAFTAVAGEFPGASDVKIFWEKIVKAETSDLTELTNKWSLKKESYYNPEPGTPDKIYIDKAFCLPDKADNRGRQLSFGIDVLKRLKYELCKDGNRYDFSKTAFVAGTSWSDEGYYVNDIDFIFSNKIDFEKTFSPEEQLKDLADSIHIGGPTIAVDTACASSLYAVETAVNLIRSGQARSAVILGLSVIIPPFLMSGFSQLRALSPEGKSLPFSEDANGMVPGEASAAVFLEPLEDAISSGRQIWGVLCSTGLSSDGSEGSVFAPGATGQQNSYKRAYINLDPSEIDYIEAHGTATVLGDKTELESMNAFFAPYFENRNNGRKLYTGSVKSIIGHSLAAAGMSSLIKVLFMLSNKIIPPHINVVPNPVIENGCIALAKEVIPLDTSKRPARIGISSFGLGGSNIHMVLESYDEKIHQLSGIDKTDDLLFPDVAILDFEAGFGNRLSVSDLHPDFYKNLKKENFPEARFGKKNTRTVNGDFFPDNIIIDVKGLRLGPNLLSRIDAFQNHTVSLANNILKRNPDVKNSPDSAITMSLNIGSAKSLKMTRKYYAKYFLDPEDVAHENIVDTTLEDIASALGSMFSGYPAYHFNLRGFHQTFSGDTSAFWRTVFMAPFMLKHHCKDLLAGAGHFIKSPIDLYNKRITGKNNSTVLEGAALFLLKNGTKAREDRNKILATIRAIIPSSLAENYEQACKIAKIPPDEIDIREFSQLDPKSDYKQENCNRFVGEATGTEVLTSILLKDGKNASIEIYNGETLFYTVFIKKHAEFVIEKPQIEMAVSIPVKDATDYLKKKAFVNRTVKKVDSAKTDVTDSKQELDFVPIFELWQGSTASAIKRFLKIQQNLVKTKNSIFQPLGKRVEIENNINESVLTNIAEKKVLDQSQRIRNQFSARLIVDESHPYFFDHPLDHIPGILILQGCIELYDIAINRTCESDMFIHELTMMAS